MTRTELEEEIVSQEGKSEYKSRRRRERSRLLEPTRDVKPIGEED